MLVVEVAEAQPPHKRLDARVGVLEGSAGRLDVDAEGGVVVARVQGIGLVEGPTGLGAHDGVAGGVFGEPREDSALPRDDVCEMDGWCPAVHRRAIIEI